MPTRILIIDPDLDAVEHLRLLLESEDLEVLTTITGQAGMVRAEVYQPDLIILDVDLPDVDGYQLCRSLRASSATSAVPILIYSSRCGVADKVAGFEAGASDFVVKPAAPAELLARIRSMARLEETARGHVVAVWGSKGGVGSSVLASNLAVALRSLDGGEVTLVDASVLGGSIGVCLNIISPHSIADLMPRFESLDTDLLDSVLANHSSGIRVLLSAPWGQDGASPLEPLQVERILGRLRQSSAYVVVDTSPSLDPTTVGVLRQADQTVVVLTPEMTALRNVRVALRVFKSWGQDPRRLIMVLNSCAAKGGILLRDVESALEAKMDVLVPSDEPMVMYSINRGIPLVSSHPKSAVGQGMLRLAQVVASRTQGQAQRLG